jgi:hypothetical protein
MRTVSDRCVAQIPLALPCACLALVVYARNLPFLDEIPHNAEIQPRRIMQTRSPQVADVLSASEDCDKWHLAVFRTMPQRASTQRKSPPKRTFHFPVRSRHAP